MSKKYRLMKDLPDAKAGTVLTKEDKPNGLYMYCGPFDGTDPDSWYSEEVVENNPDWFQEIKEPEPPKEWEIVALIGKDSKSIYRKKDGMWLNERSNGWGDSGESYGKLEGTGCAIHSVLRKSDNITFSIGDEVRWDISQLPGNSKKPFTIASFQINNILPEQRMFINNQNIDICYLEKLPPSTPAETKEGFVWTDELVKEFIHRRCGMTDGFFKIYNELVESFKQSKQPSHFTKEAIEDYVNKHTDTKEVYDSESVNAYLSDEAALWDIPRPAQLKFASPKKYTQQQMDEEMEKAFNAGRSRFDGFLNDHITNWIYNSFNHFKNNLK